MKPYSIAALLLTAAMAFSAAGCSDKSRSKAPTETSSIISNLQDPLASNSVEAGLTQETDLNQTMYTLNRVIDSGRKSEEGERFIYLDLTIRNSSNTDYELNCLNNFYILLDDGSEVHFDVRTQLYAQKHIKDFISGIFTVTAGSEISGITGGFLLKPDITSFKVCLFPTGASGNDKSSVIKVPITTSDIISLPTELFIPDPTESATENNQ